MEPLEEETSQPNGAAEGSLSLFSEPAHGVLSELTAAIESLKGQNQALTASLAAGPAEQQSVAQVELARVNTELEALRKEHAHLIARDRQRASTEASLHAQLQVATSKHKALGKRFDKLQDSHYTLQRLAERYRIELHHLGGGTKSDGANGTAAPSLSAATPPPTAIATDNMSVEPSATSTGGPSSEEVEKFKQEVEEFKLIADSRKSNIDQLLKEKQELISKVQQLEEVCPYFLRHIQY